MSNLPPVSAATGDLSTSFLPDTQVLANELEAAETPPEDPCALALVLLKSMICARNSLKPESEKTMLSLRAAFEALGRRYQALSTSNEALRTRLNSAVHAQRSKMARYASEKASLTISVQQAKIDLQKIRELIEKIPAGIQNKLEIATLKKQKAILKATKTCKKEVLRLRKEYSLAQAAQSASQINLCAILRSFDNVKVAYKARQSQLEVDLKAASEALEQGHASRPFYENIKRFRVMQLLSQRACESYQLTDLLARLPVAPKTLTS